MTYDENTAPTRRLRLERARGSSPRDTVFEVYPWGASVTLCEGDRATRRVKRVEPGSEPEPTQLEVRKLRRSLRWVAARQIALAFGLGGACGLLVAVAALVDLAPAARADEPTPAPVAAAPPPAGDALVERAPAAEVTAPPAEAAAPRVQAEDAARSERRRARRRALRRERRRRATERRLREPAPREERASGSPPPPPEPPADAWSAFDEPGF